MRTIYPVIGVLCVLTMAAVWQLAGVGALFAASGPGSQLDTGQFNNTSDQYNPDTGFSGDASSSDDGDIVGMIISGTGDITSLSGLVNLIPNILVSFGLPWAFAFPLGQLSQIIVLVGVVQFAVNRDWR